MAHPLDRLWRMRGGVVLRQDADPDAALTRAATFLQRQDKPVRRRTDGVLTFRHWFFQPQPSWRALVMFDRGRVWIDRTGETPMLRWDLDGRTAVVFCLVISLCFALIPFAHGERGSVGIGLLLFVWLYGMNRLLAALRVPGAFRRAMGEMAAE